MIQWTVSARVSHKTVYSFRFIFIASLQKIAIETRASVNNIVNETHYVLWSDQVHLPVSGKKVETLENLLT